MAPKLYYFQAPNFDINPESEIAPKLGSILPNLDRLTGSLNQGNIVEIPTNLQNRSSTTIFSDEVYAKYRGSPGLNLNAIQGILASANILYGFTRKTSHVYRCERLDTIEFEHTDEYISQAMRQSQRTWDFIERRFVGKKKVYMITGLKIATGLDSSTSKEIQHNPQLDFQVDGTTMAAPVGGGPTLDFEIATGRTLSPGKSENQVIFAYRVIRIKLKGDGEPKSKLKYGGLYAEEGDQGNSDEAKEPWDVEQMDEELMIQDLPPPVRD
ncbi:hypothetical protein N7540_002093 [Penicillium herquei]|nr:hypothetical protein N7540_002093 [Penicillium herquei]